MAFEELPLLRFIRALSPEFQEPDHLKPWCDLIESCVAGGIRGLCAVPIRHFKTETTIHGIAWLLVQDPTMRIICMYADHDMANDRGKRIRQVCEAAGVGPVRGTNTITSWQNDAGGGVQTMSAKQSRLGQDCDVLIFDDPLSELDADDPTIRQAVDMAIAHYTARAGRPSRRGSVLGVMSPWHPDDPYGRRKSRVAERWNCWRSPAIIDEGQPTERAFAPEIMTLDELKRRREELREADPTERIWYAQFQTDPQPEGASLFGPPTLYRDLPTYGYRVAHGVDFAYTDAAGSDFFAAVTGRIFGRKLYVLEVQRHKLDATLLESTCKALMTKYGRAPFWSYQSGPEIGMSKLLIGRGVPVAPMPARYNKLVRAQKTVRRWNDGEILIPEALNCPWQPGFLHRVAMFRGHEKDRDDEVDALVSVADAMLGGATMGASKVPGAAKPYAGMFG